MTPREEDAEALLREIHDFARASYASVALTERRGFSDMQTIVNKIRRFWKLRGSAASAPTPASGEGDTRQG